MKLLMTLLVAGLFSFGASYAHACGLDAVSGKTDTTITISWDVQCPKFKKVEICWKKAANSGNVCNAPTKQSTDTTGSYTIEGLSPSTAYKIKTHWYGKSIWHEITVRTVTTNPPPAATTTVLRYEKGTGQTYCVDFYWKNPPPSNPDWTLALGLKSTLLWIWTDIPYVDLTGASFNSSTGEYTVNKCEFSNNRKYRAYIYKRSLFGDNLGAISNWVQWK